MKEIYAYLEQYGLTKRQTLVYVHLIQNIEDTILGISKTTSIPRASLYKIMEGLKEKHLVSKFRKNKTEFWVAESLAQLEQDLQVKQQALQNALPLLKNLAGSGFFDTESVRIFLGKEGMKTVMEDIITTLEDQKEPFVYAISNEDIFKYLPRYFPKWVQRRQKNKTFAKLILNSSHRYTQTNEYQEVRYLDTKYMTSGDVTLYGDKIAIFSFSKTKITSLIIESISVQNIILGLFKYMWETLEQKT
ncbi:hypothetical protein H6776_02055 [Candidatus Nomurabacteria bacterium]|nr:hypothetical protein [Candidatus Nomurabacteria bacterium]